MRNSWRFSIDDATGDIWVGDVGESNWSPCTQLEGAYIFADMSLPLLAMGTDGVTPITLRLSSPVTSFGERPNRELYVLTLQGGAYLLGPA